MNQDNRPPNGQQLEEARQVWNDAASTFDSEPDHGLRTPETRAAWKALLRDALPTDPCHILDIGCGTGSLSVVMAEMGHSVTGVDFSPAMIALAEEKASVAGVSIKFLQMDAAFPEFPPQQFDVLVCRHLLWALPEPQQVLIRWAELLKPGGQMILIEGYWHTDAGLHADEIIKMMPETMTSLETHRLSHQGDLWGGTVNDERYLIRVSKK